MTTPTLTTEQILTHPKAFGLTTATPLQRALCRVLDGRPLGELACLDDVRESVGEVEALPTDAPPYEVHVLAGIRSAKSLIAAARIITLSQSVDLSALGPGDIVRIPLAALKLEGTRAVMSHLVENVQAKPLLRPLLVGEPTTAGVSLRHPSGRAIEVTPIPLDRAGGSALSVWNAGIVADEEPRMMGEADGVKNWDHLRRAVLGRLLPGAQLLGIGSPWAPFGPVYDMVQEHGGKPSPDLVIFRARGPAMNPSWWTPQRCAALERRDPQAYRTDVLAEFADPETALISSDELTAVTRAKPMILEPRAEALYVAAMDPATRGNSWTLVVIEIPARRGPTRIALVKQWTGSKAAPLSPETVLAEIATTIAPYALRKVHTDQLAADFVKDLGKRIGLEVRDETQTAASKLEMMSSLQTAIAAREIELPPDPVVRRDLLALRRRVTQTGVAIVAPRSGDGRHADHSSSIALGLHVARRMGRLSGSGQRRPLPPIQLLGESLAPAVSLFGSDVGAPVPRNAAIEAALQQQFQHLTTPRR